MALLVVGILVAVLTQTEAFQQYADLIPNGNRVLNPCPGGGIWTAVGHNAIAGGGPRNQFGTDFAASNYVWTPRLCRLDSDGDGRSNGVELGDPRCRWTVGSNRRLGAPTGHPGECEPLGSPVCAGQLSSCGFVATSQEEDPGHEEEDPAHEEEAPDHDRSRHAWGAAGAGGARHDYSADSH